MRAQVPNDTAAEKTGSAEHGDGAIGRCYHDSNSPIHVVSNGPPDAVGARRLLLFLCWCARKHGSHTFRVDVEGQEYQRLVAWVSSLVHESVRFIDQRTWSPCLRLTVDRVRSGAGNNKVQSRS
ncbi:MAG: hypothetical protein QOJ51_6836 [Acidobacteriaceae bacterium]|nr:hypothetical protein [Acidobacteriaceae bacterium]